MTRSYDPENDAGMDGVQERFRGQAANDTRTEAEIEMARLRHENDMLTKAGIIEVAVRNPSVAEYMRHWEGRAEKAEAALSALSQPALPGQAKPRERWPVPGDRMRFLGENGYPFELEAALKVMQPGDTFTVSSGTVGGFSNTIRFEEIDGSWNGVMFDFAAPLAPEVPDTGGLVERMNALNENIWNAPVVDLGAALAEAAADLSRLRGERNRANEVITEVSADLTARAEAAEKDAKSWRRVAERLALEK